MLEWTIGLENEYRHLDLSPFKLTHYGYFIVRYMKAWSTCAKFLHETLNLD
jgi:hypothetical protein